jgi:hypothetical protein
LEPQEEPRRRPLRPWLQQWVRRESRQVRGWIDTKSLPSRPVDGIVVREHPKQRVTSLCKPDHNSPPELVHAHGSHTIVSRAVELLQVNAGMDRVFKLAWQLPNLLANRWLQGGKVVEELLCEGRGSPPSSLRPRVRVAGTPRSTRQGLAGPSRRVSMVSLPGSGECRL